MKKKFKFLSKFLNFLFIFQFLFFIQANAEFNAPLNPKLWKALEFSSIKANKYSGNDQSLVIEVNRSSSPLIYKLETPLKFKSVHIAGEIIDGILELKDQKQGVFKNKKSITDDYVLRFGLVLKGKNKKPPVPNFLLAAWIKEMFSLAPKGVGIDKIYFLKVAHNPEHVGDTRNHPLSDYLFEEAVTSAQTGAFEINKNFKTTQEALGFWISANGEGTSSSFKTKITKIELE